MQIEHTERGFQIIRFTDLYNNHCSLQQSSLAVYEQPGSGAIWLGLSGDRMHISFEQAQELSKYLQVWIETGRFDMGAPICQR